MRRTLHVPHNVGYAIPSTILYTVKSKSEFAHRLNHYRIITWGFCCLLLMHQSRMAEFKHRSVFSCGRWPFRILQWEYSRKSGLNPKFTYLGVAEMKTPWASRLRAQDSATIFSFPPLSAALSLKLQGGLPYISSPWMLQLLRCGRSSCRKILINFD